MISLKTKMMFAVIGMMGAAVTGGKLHSAKAAPDVAGVSVTTTSTPDGGIQPQSVVDSKGRGHLLYFKGDPAGGDLYYTQFTPGSSSHTPPIRVNSQPRSAGATGTVRTAQIALGKDDRVHVVWNGFGSKDANGYPVAYQAYARLNDTGTAFEPQRNLTTWAKGLDGGGSVAADKAGSVYVFWHAMANAKDESGRAVFVARSSDNGKTFARETQANPEPTGACACCGMKALVDSKGVVYVLYRTAGENVRRDTLLLVSRDRGMTFQAKRLDSWKIRACPMSTYALAENAGRVWAAWENESRIYYGSIDPATLAVSTPITLTGDRLKHPFLASGANGQALLAWTEGTGWQKGGALAWTVLTEANTPIQISKLAGAIPMWGLPTAYPTAKGFVVLH